MLRMISLALCLSVACAPVAWAYEWEGAWGMDERDCKDGGTVALNKSEIDTSFEESCDVKKITTVGSETLITALCSGEGPSLTRKISLRIVSDRLLIRGLAGQPDPLMRCVNNEQKSK